MVGGRSGGMFWRKKKTARRSKRLTQREIISHIEQLSADESLSYRLPESYGGQVAVVEFNTEYPWRGSKYLLSMQTLVDGKPTGEKERVLESDEAKEIAAWLSGRRGKLLSLPES
jgi:hypothetical protein